MAASSKPADLTVRSHSQYSLQEHQQRPQHQRPSRGPELVRCQSYCCSPVRPQLERNAASFSTSSSSSSSPERLLYSPGTDGSSHLQSEDGSVPDYFGDHVDASTFEQILEMDDDEEEREFSKSIVYDFFDQAQVTFGKMDSFLEKKDLAQLSALGHFLKGSSATLGLTKLKDSCEKIQHYGAKKDATGTDDEPDDEKCLSNCKKTIAQAKEEFKDAEGLLRRFYHDNA